MAIPLETFRLNALLLEKPSPYLGLAAEKAKLSILSQIAMRMFALQIQSSVEKKTSAPKIFKIDLSETSPYGTTDHMVLKAELEKRGLYGKEFGYSAFNPALADKVKNSGTYYKSGHKNSNEMWCCLLYENEDGEEVISHQDHETLVGYMEGHYESIWCFAIYDLNHFTQGEEQADDNNFVFKNPKNKLAALRGIAFVNLGQATD